MSKPHDTYTKSLFAQQGYMATWLPNVPMAVGDVGVVSSREFSRVTTLESLGLRFALRQPGPPIDIHFASSTDVQIRTKAAGDAPLDGCSLSRAEGGFVIDFNKRGGFAFSARGLVASAIEDQETLGREICERAAIGAWEREYFVVTEVLRAESLSLFIAADERARVELKTETNVQLPSLNAASVALELQLANAQRLFTQIKTAAATTPLFRGRRLKRRLFRRPVFRGPVFRAGSDSERLLDLEPEDFDGSA